MTYRSTCPREEIGWVVTTCRWASWCIGSRETIWQMWIWLILTKAKLWWPEGWVWTSPKRLLSFSLRMDKLMNLLFFDLAALKRRPHSFISSDLYRSSFGEPMWGILWHLSKMFLRSAVTCLPLYTSLWVSLFAHISDQKTCSGNPAADNTKRSLKCQTLVTMLYCSFLS